MCATSSPRMESDTKEGKSHAVDHFRNTPGAVASRDGEFLHPRRIHSHTSSLSRSRRFDSRYPRPQSGRLSLQARDGVAYRPSSIFVGEKPTAWEGASSSPFRATFSAKPSFPLFNVSAQPHCPPLLKHWNSPVASVSNEVSLALRNEPCELDQGHGHWGISPIRHPTHALNH